MSHIDEKLVRLLIVAQGDFQLAYNICNEYKKSKNNFYNWYSIFVSAVIVYARCFKPNSDRTCLPPSFVVFPQDKMRDIHDKAIMFRDKVVAHADLEYRSIHIGVVEAEHTSFPGEKFLHFSGSSGTYIYGNESIDDLMWISEYQCLSLQEFFQDEVAGYYGSKYGVPYFERKEKHPIL